MQKGLMVEMPLVESLTCRLHTEVSGRAPPSRPLCSAANNIDTCGLLEKIVALLDLLSKPSPEHKGLRNPTTRTNQGPKPSSGFTDEDTIVT